MYNGRLEGKFITADCQACSGNRTIWNRKWFLKRQIYFRVFWNSCVLLAIFDFSKSFTKKIKHVCVSSLQYPLVIRNLKYLTLSACQNSYLTISNRINKFSAICVRRNIQLPFLKWKRKIYAIGVFHNMPLLLDSAMHDSNSSHSVLTWEKLRLICLAYDEGGFVFSNFNFLLSIRL